MSFYFWLFSLLIKLDQLINDSQPVTCIMLAIMIPVDKRSVPFWRHHMTSVFPAQIVSHINHGNVCLCQCCFVVIDHWLELFPEITVLERLYVLLNHSSHIPHMPRVQLNDIYVDLIRYYLHSLTTNLIDEINKLGNILSSLLIATVSKWIR